MTHSMSMGRRLLLALLALGLFASLLPAQEAESRGNMSWIRSFERTRPDPRHGASWEEFLQREALPGLMTDDAFKSWYGSGRSFKEVVEWWDDNGKTSHGDRGMRFVLGSAYSSLREGGYTPHPAGPTEHPADSRAQPCGDVQPACNDCIDDLGARAYCCPHPKPCHCY